MEKKLLSDSASAIDIGALKVRYPNLDSISLQWFKADTILEELVQVLDGEDGTLAIWEVCFSWGPVKHLGKGSIAR